MADEQSVAVPDHTMLSRLGKGGMASVWLAREERLGRLVAVKVIDERLDADPHFRKRFEREARTAAALAHPNIVPIYHYGFTMGGRPFISMAFLEGGSLRERLQRRGTYDVVEALAITKQIASGLQAAHGRNVIHRDLKPDNVLFQGETALLTDFGIAKVMDASTELTGTGVNPGTAKYFSPEQALERPLDQRSDIYTLGVVLYEMLTGRGPIEADSVARYMMRIAFDPPTALPAELKGLQPFMDVLLAKEPSDRLGSCTDVVSIITAMERNWMRFDSLDRLTDGVQMTPSKRGAATVSQDDETLIEGGTARRAGSSDARRSTDPTDRLAALPDTFPPRRTADAPMRSETFDLTPSANRAVVSTPGSEERRFAVLTLEVSPADALVLLDYADETGAHRREVWTGKPLRMAIGRIGVVASAAGHDELRRTLQLGAGERVEVVELAPNKPAAAALRAVETQPVASSATPRGEQRGSAAGSAPSISASAPAVKGARSVRAAIAMVVLPAMILIVAFFVWRPWAPQSAPESSMPTVTGNDSAFLRTAAPGGSAPAAGTAPIVRGTTPAATVTDTESGAPYRVTPLPPPANRAQDKSAGARSNVPAPTSLQVAAPVVTAPVAPVVAPRASPAAQTPSQGEAFIPVAAVSESSVNPISVHVKFTNRGSQPVRLLWVDYSGTEKFYSEILPGDTLDQQTYAGHLWRIERGDQLLATYRATAAPLQSYDVDHP